VQLIGSRAGPLSSTASASSEGDGNNRRQTSRWLSLKPVRTAGGTDSSSPSPSPVVAWRVGRSLAKVERGYYVMVTDLVSREVFYSDLLSVVDRPVTRRLGPRATVRV
jgi:hypothetical protein